MYIDIYIDSFILTLKKIHFLLSQIEKKNENMKKKIIDYLIDYACPIISDNRLWNFSDCTSLTTVKSFIFRGAQFSWILEIEFILRDIIVWA